MNPSKFKRMMTEQETQIFEDMRQRIIKILCDDSYYQSQSMTSIYTVRLEVLTRLVVESFGLALGVDLTEELISDFSVAIRDAVFSVKIK